MAKSSTTSRPGRALAALLVLVALLFALIPLVAPDRLGERRLSFTDRYLPRLGLDLEGGTSIILQPRAADASAGRVTEENIDQAVEIIRQRVDGFGVAEAEVAAQGAGENQTIVISIPGERNEAILDRVRQTAELRFRQVLAAAPAAPAPQTPPATPAAPGVTPAATPSPAASPAATPSPAASPAATVEPAPTPTADSRAIPSALAAATPTATPSASPTPSPTATPTGPGEITPELQRQFEALTCTEDQVGDPAPADQPIVACDRSGAIKYILGRAELVGTAVRDATAGIGTTQQGASTGQWQVDLAFTGEGTDQFAAVTTRVTTQPPPTNQLAIVLDDRVVSAPSINEPITGGRAQITGSFTQSEAQDLANVLRYGALPLSFTAGSVEEISPTLGADQLQAGLVAGALGLALVVVYSLLYYRGLGLVSIFSLVVASVLTYGTVVLLGWQIGFRLSLAGVAGLIVAIGITADSFIVYFERLRDEVREGRSLRVAVETGWARARRTILAADFVSLLAAIVLYLLSVGGVRGFAFTLGLTTLIDIVVVFLFTKPLVTLLARMPFFGQGHPLSGLDPRRLAGSTWRPRATRPAALARSTPRASARPQPEEA